MPRWGPSYLEKNAKWYTTDEARAVADNVLAYQSGFGAWPKNTDLVIPATADAIDVLNRGGKANTIDLDYLLSARYENGGRPRRRFGDIGNSSDG